MTYGLIWHEFTPGAEDGIANLFGIDVPTTLPIFFSKKSYDLILSGDPMNIPLIPGHIILGMLVALVPQEKRLVDISEHQFVEALKYIARTEYGDPDCQEMLRFACEQLEKHHTHQDAQLVARVGEKHFGIQHMYAGDN